MDLREAYRVLELEPGTEREGVREARNVLAKVWHPDRHQGDPKLQSRAEQKLRQINEAYEAVEAAGFPTRLAPPPPAEPPPPSPSDPLGYIRWQLAREGKLWAIAHLDDVAQGGRDDELAYWVVQYQRGLPSAALISPPPFGKRSTKITQQLVDAWCSTHPNEARATLAREFLHYLVPVSDRAASEPLPPRAGDPPTHEALRYDFLIWRIATELEHVSRWTAEPLTYRPGPIWAKVSNVQHLVGFYVDAWRPPEALVLRSTSAVTRRALLTPAVTRYARARHLIDIAKMVPMDVARAERQLDWASDVLCAASHAAGLQPRISLPHPGLRGTLEEIQLAFLDRFQPNGYQNLIEVVKREALPLSDRDENASTLKKFAMATSVLPPDDGTKLMLRFVFPHSLPPLPSEDWPPVA